MYINKFHNYRAIISNRLFLWNISIPQNREAYWDGQ